MNSYKSAMTPIDAKGKLSVDGDHELGKAIKPSPGSLSKSIKRLVLETHNARTSRVGKTSRLLA